jgi:hypothetical protein
MQDKEMEYAVRENGCSGGDVYGGAAGEVEHPPFVGPALRAPGPSRDWIVDERGPEHDEDEEVTGPVFARDGPLTRDALLRARESMDTVFERSIRMVLLT